MTPTGGWCYAWSSSKNDKAVQGRRSAQNISTNINQEEREQDQPGRLVERPAGQSIQQAKYLTSSYLYPGGQGGRAELAFQETPGRCSVIIQGIGFPEQKTSALNIDHVCPILGSRSSLDYIFQP